jgi:hypothetical protein
LDSGIGADEGSGFAAGTKPVKSSDRPSSPEETAGFVDGAVEGPAPDLFPGAGLVSGFFDGGGLFLPNSEKTTRYLQFANGLRQWEDELIRFYHSCSMQRNAGYGQAGTRRNLGWSAALSRLSGGAFATKGGYQNTHQDDGAHDHCSGRQVRRH